MSFCSIVTQHRDDCKNFHPFIGCCEKVPDGKIRRHKMEPNNVPEDTGDNKGCRLKLSVFAAQIQDRSEKQGGSTAVHDKGVERQQGKSQKIQRKLKIRIRECHHENGCNYREKQGNQYGGEAAPPFFSCAPVKPLQDNDED